MKRTLLCLLLALEGLFVLTLAMESLGRLRFDEMVAVLTVTMLAGVYLSILCVDLVDSDQSRGSTLKNEVSILADYYRATSQDFAVRCQVKEGEVNLIDLTLTVPDEQTAAAICNNWHKKSSALYGYLMEELL